mmetsp:Transcript_34295/g.54951  ORF Transcript_34295/g.54951 Transcript_34295/m.54951 type:complete len:161 (+) Transcript_34295:744-1226(+)
MYREQPTCAIEYNEPDKDGFVPVGPPVAAISQPTYQAQPLVPYEGRNIPPQEGNQLVPYEDGRTISPEAVDYQQASKHQTPVPQTNVIYVEAPAQQLQQRDPRLVAKGMAAGGNYQDRKYCGPCSWAVCLIFPCVCCCPCDTRTLYTEPGTGRRVYLKKR